MKKIIALVSAICLIISSFYGCNVKQTDVTSTPSETSIQTKQPVSTPLITETSAPVSPESQTPSPEPSPEAEVLTIVETYITTNTEENPLAIYQGETTQYVYYVWLHIKFNTEINHAIRKYLEINGQPVDRNLVDIQDETLSIFLRRDLPEEVVVTLNKGYKIFQYTLDSEYTYEFNHEPALVFDFAFYDSSSSTKIPGVKLLMRDSQEFMYTFNKPVIQESLEYSSNLSSDDIKKTWLNDTELVISVKNITEGYNWVSIDNISGIDQIYGNKLRREGWLNGFEAGLFGFYRIPQQAIYAVVPETAEVETVYEPEYGLVYLSMSPDSRFMELGIVTGASEFGLGYKIVILDTMNMKLSALEALGKGIIPDTILEKAILPRNYRYEGPRYYEVWDDIGNMHFEYGNLYNYNIADETFSLFYDDTEKDFVNFPDEHMSGGSLVYLRPDELVTHEGVPLSLVIVSPAGVIEKIYETPFISKAIAYMTFYMADIEEIDEDRLLIYGYAQVDSNPNLQSAYILNLQDGSTEFVTKNSSILGYFADAGLVVASDLVLENESSDISFISLGGDTVSQIKGDYNKNILDITYNPSEENFYLKQHDRVENIYSLMIFNIDDNMLVESGITFENDFDMMGFDGKGKILVMEHVAFLP